MRTLRNLLFLTVIISILSATPTLARFDSWDSENGVMIRQGHHVFWNGEAMISDGIDRWLIAWADARNGSMDVFAQLYDAEGNELWTAGGMIVANGRWPEEMPMLVYAGNDEWIIGWQDYRLDVNYMGEMVVYAQKYNSQGEALWTEGGVFIGPEGGNQVVGKFQTPPELVKTNDGGVICVFQNEFEDEQFFAQRLSSNGEKLWNEAGVVLSETNSIISVASDDENGMFFTLNRIGRVGDVQLSLHHLNADGERCWGEGSSGLALDVPNGTDHHANIVSDGNGGALVSWVVSRQGNTYPIFGQHVNSKGEFLWGEMGAELVLLDDNSLNIKMISTTPGEFYLVWKEPAHPIYAQRISSSEQGPVLHWGAGDLEQPGLIVSEGCEDNFLSTVSSDRLDGMVITWGERNEPGYRDFKVQRLNDQGETYWNEAQEIRVRDMDCSSQNVVALQDRLFFAWRESSPPVSGISYQAYALDDGAVQFEDYSIPVVSGVASFTERPQIIRSGDAVYISWTDARYSPFGRMPYMQKVDLETGQPLWENLGINIAPGNLAEYDSGNVAIYHPVEMIEDGADGVIAVWSKEKLFAQRVDEDGALLWGENGVSVFGERDYSRNITPNREIFPNGDGGVTVVAALSLYEERTNQIRIQKLNADGQSMLGETGVLIYENNTLLPTMKGVIQLSNSEILVLWMNEQILEAMKVNEDGDFLWEEPVDFGEFESRYPNVSVTEAQNTIVAACTEKFEESYRTDMIYRDFHGDPVFNQEKISFLEYEDNSQVTSFYSDEDKCWVAFLRGTELYLTSTYNQEPQMDEDRTQLVSTFNNTSVLTRLVSDGAGGVYVFFEHGVRDKDIHYMHYDRNVELVGRGYENGPVPLVDERFLQMQMCMVPDNEGGVLTVWNDWRGSTGFQECDDVYAMRVNDDSQLSSPGPREDMTPTNYSLAAAYPNPFNSSTKITFTLPEVSDVSVSVSDIMGRKIANLTSGNRAAGEHTIVWNAHDFAGQNVVSGMYICTMESQGVSLQNKLFLIR